MMKSIDKLYQKLNSNLKEKAISYEGKKTPEHLRYEHNLVKFSRSKFKITNLKELLNSINQSDIIYLGDFHTFDQQTKNLERILKQLINKKNKFSLGLEMVQAKDQVFIDAYLQNELTEKEFLESIRYYETWKFPWSNYKVLFDMAKKFKFNITGLNSRGTLKERDLYASKILRTLLNENKYKKILVLFGELHILANKIPLLVKESNPPSLKQLIIHQNIEQLYWKLSKKNQLQEIIKFSSSSIKQYHLITTPPWTKYESINYWYENLLENDDFDLHRYIIETGLKTTLSDCLDQITFFEKEISKILHRKSIRCDSIELLDQTQIENIKKKINQIKNKNAQKYFNILIEKNRPFILPNQDAIYCPNYSFNRLTYATGLYYFDQSAHYVFDQANNKTEVLNYLLNQYCFAFFCSKIFNPHRKCPMYMDLKVSSDIAIKLIDQRNKKIVSTLSEETIIETSKLIGHFLGELLYRGILKKSQTKKFMRIIDELLKGNFLKDQMQLSLIDAILINKEYKNLKKNLF